MIYANDNTSENVIPIYKKIVENITKNPHTLLAEDLSLDLYHILEDEGYDITELEMCRDLAVIGEMILAMLKRYYGEYYPYQDFLDQISIACVPDRED